MTGSRGHGTDRATADVPDGVTGHTGPPVPSLEERERVRWLPGCPEPGTLCTESKRDCHMEVGTKVFPSGPPSGAGSVRVAALMSRLIFQMMGLTMRAGGRIGGMYSG